eukprot:6210107-Pleurochrysis_carterae.AAC.2
MRRGVGRCVDMHQGTSDVGFNASKDKFATALRSYLVRNQGNHGGDFAGGACYSDNQIVLNSAKVGPVLKDFNVYHTISCEYEPWQIPTERHMRMLQEPMRVKHERGGAGEGVLPVLRRVSSLWGDKLPAYARQGCWTNVC